MGDVFACPKGILRRFSDTPLLHASFYDASCLDVIIPGVFRVAAEDVKPRMLPSGEHPHHLLRYLPLIQQHPEHLVPDDGLQLFEFQGRRNAEHALFTIKASICYENVGAGIESEKIAKRLHSDHGAGDGIVFRNCILEKNL